MVLTSKDKIVRENLFVFRSCGGSMTVARTTEKHIDLLPHVCLLVLTKTYHTTKFGISWQVKYHRIIVYKILKVL